MGELTKKAEAIQQDLSLSKLADLVIEICKVIEKPTVIIQTGDMALGEASSKKIIEISGTKDGKDVQVPKVRRKK